MTSDGSPYGRVPRALKTGNVNLALASVRGLPAINLSDSLSSASSSSGQSCCVPWRRQHRRRPTRKDCIHD
jgi:hypothetical protein